MKSLDTLPLGTVGKIEDVKVSSSLKRRLFDLGFIPGTFITPLYRSFLGDPTAYSIRGTIIAIRKQDAKEIFIHSHTHLF